MPLRIAQIAPLWEKIPPPLYGGTERVVYSLTEGLIKKGHEVTLYASGDSQTSARLVSVYPRPLYRDGIAWTDIIYPTLNITEAFDHEKDYDIIHVHLNKMSDYIALPLSAPIRHKVLFTFHFVYPLNQNRLSRHVFLQKYKDRFFSSISNSQRTKGENLNWMGTVYNGIDLSHYTFVEKPKDYFVWLGRFSRDKGSKETILAAKKAKVQLILAGKIDTQEEKDYRYYKDEVEPLIDGKQITYIGEADDKKKNELFGHAKAFINPIQWEEPFGLVMTETMATGTPVIAYPRGAAVEIVDDGITGFLVKNIDNIVKKIDTIQTIDRKQCRERVEKFFSDVQMTEGYEKIYEKIVTACHAELVSASLAKDPEINSG